MITYQHKMERWLWALAIIAALLLIEGLLSRFPTFVDRVYTQKIFYVLRKVQITLSSIVPFSIAEFTVIFSALSVLGWLGYVTFDAYHGPNPASETLKLAGVQLLTVGLGATLFFYSFWGLNYARPNVEDRAGWEKVHEEWYESAEARRLTHNVCQELIVLTNNAYYELNGCEDAQQATDIQLTREEMDDYIEEAFQEFSQEWPESQSLMASTAPRAKATVTSIPSYLGLSGFYFPWTGEANYNGYAPAYELPHTIAHEKAHQRGLGTESECNFLAVLICLRAKHPAIRYSGALFARDQMLQLLEYQDCEDAAILSQQSFLGPRHDKAMSRAFWGGYQGSLMSVGEQVNDSYLKFNGVEGGVTSYERSSILLLRFARHNNGSLILPPS